MKLHRLDKVKPGKKKNKHVFLQSGPNDLSFIFQNPVEQMGRIVQIRAVDDGQLDSGTDEHEHTEEVPVEDATVDIAGNISDDPQDVVVENMESVRTEAVDNMDNVVMLSTASVEAEAPSGIFVTSSESSHSPVTRAKSDARVTVLAVEGNRITEKGDAASVTVDTQVPENQGPQKVHIVSSDSKHSYVVKLREPARQSETEKQNVVVEMNEGGDHAINIKLEKVLTPGKQQDGALKDSDPVTMAAVKSILPDNAGAVANVLNEIEVGGEGTSPEKIGETTIEMTDSSMNTTGDLVVNESELLDDDSDDDDDEEDEDDDDTIEVSTSSMHSELLSRLTETFTPPGADQSSTEDKKTVTPRQHYKCNICNRVFYGPNKFKSKLISIFEIQIDSKVSYS